MGSHGKIHLGEIYPTHEPKQPLQAEPELPSHMIEVKLRLSKNIKQDWFRHAKDHLRRNNMSVTVDLNSKNTVTVTGTPPDHHFNQRNVLEIVQRYDPGAQMISHRELRM